MNEFYMIHVEGENVPAYKRFHDSRGQAEKEAGRIAKTSGKSVFVSVVIAYKKEIDPFKEACEYLGYEDDLRCGIAVRSNYIKVIGAIYKLIVIAEAWNKQDDFVPDFSDGNQRKYFPCFYYDADTAGFVYSHVACTASYMYTAIDVHLCFKTGERAEQFGKQFIDLWNDFLTIK